MGRKATVGVFKELHQDSGDGVETLYTLKEEDDGDIKSFPQLFYKHYKDPTEMTLVKEAFDGDFETWDAIRQSPMFSKYYAKLRKKADMLLMSDAFTEITRIAFDESNKNNFTALKYLVDRGAKASTPTSRGRPKKEKAVETVDTSDLAADIARLSC